MADDGSNGTVGGDQSKPATAPIVFGRPELASSSTPPATDSSYDPIEASDRTRTQIAWALLGITAFIIFATVIMAFWVLWQKENGEENLKTILAITNILFGPIIALLGSVIGFYFGSRAANGSSGNQ